MRIIIVDDEPFALEQFRMMMEGTCGENFLEEFTDAYEALRYVRKSWERGESLELALLDVEMPKMNGLELMRELRKIYPRMVIMFITGHEKYAIRALREKADYYIMKPFIREDISECMERARLLSARQNKRLRARTFGRFDLFVDGNLVRFKNSKAKELLALCVDHRGGEVTMEEAIDKLWEDRVYDSRVKQRYRTTVMQLRVILREQNVSELFESKRGKCHIDANLIDCDYYDLLNGNEDALRRFDYEYMIEYSWAEETLGSLCEYVEKLEE